MNWLRKLFGGGTSPAAATTVATLRKEAGNIYVLRLGGVLNKATVDRIQGLAAQDISRGAKSLKVLIILDGFRGWKQGDNWGDLDFFAQYEADIAKIAVVGDARWKSEIMIFLAASQRTGAVQFFPIGQEAQARAWLAAE